MTNVMQLLLVLLSSGLIYALIGDHVRRDLHQAWKELRQLLQRVVK